MWQEFKEFAVKGNALDLAIGVILGVAFGKVVSSLVGDILTPPLGLLTNGIDFSSLFIALNGQSYPSLAAAKAAGAPTINVGVFINSLIDFAIVAFAIFIVVKQINRLRRQPEKAPATPTAPTTEEKLLSEIRDLLRDKRTTA